MKCYNKECPYYNEIKSLMVRNNCTHHRDVNKCDDRITSEENKRTDKIQITEEQSDLIIDEFEIMIEPDKRCDFKKWAKERLKEKGYIKKSNLEIARENFIKVDCGSVTTNRYNALFYYMSELEKEVERLNK